MAQILNSPWNIHERLKCKNIVKLIFKNQIGFWCFLVVGFMSQTRVEFVLVRHTESIFHLLKLLSLKKGFNWLNVSFSIAVFTFSVFARSTKFFSFSPRWLMTRESLCFPPKCCGRTAKQKVLFLLLLPETPSLNLIFFW